MLSIEVIYIISIACKFNKGFIQVYDRIGACQYSLGQPLAHLHHTAGTETGNLLH